MHRRVSSLITGGVMVFTMVLGTAVAASAAMSSAAAPAGLAAVRANCSGCHREISPGHFDRISEERKTPEGWAMTIFRMRHLHGVKLTGKEQATIIQYLSDVQGLAPSETAPARFALERRPNVPDLKLPYHLHEMCGRCHSLARVALQRRTAAEWLKLINFHVGQFPTLEYQDGSRDIYWWKIATTQLPGELAKLFPLQSAAWRNWSDHPHPSLAGEWIVHGYTPGRGDYYGTARIRRTARHRYRARYQLHYASGAALEGSSDAILYTGFEWRGTGKLGGKRVHEVYFASTNGMRITGRWFLTDHSEIGGDWVASRATGAPQILAVIPSALKTGTTQRVIVVGIGLHGSVDLGPGTKSKVLQRTPYGLILTARVQTNATPGYRSVRIGPVHRGDLLAVYRHVDRLKVEPSLAIARLGGGTLAPVDAQFHVIGYTDVVGAGGKVIAVRLGAVPVTWSLEPFNAEAARRGDVRFAGTLGQDGRFLPAAGGPDPKRQFSGDNTGDLFVVASHIDGKTAVTGRAHLIVTVQRWINPPIY